MTGVVGGRVGNDELDAMAAAAWDEPWYETDRGVAGSLGVHLRHHGAKDPEGHAFWQDDHRLGVCHGVVTNRRALGLSDADLFERVLDDPHAILPKLDGPFAIACLDAREERVVLAVDKLGARQWYYTPNEPFRFGTSVGPLLAGIDSPKIDRRGISDLLLVGQVWGDRTLVEEVRSLPAASVLEYDDGERTVSQYRTFDFGRSGGQEYASALARRYRRAVSETARTVDGRVGLWLSGGLDSRALGTVLADQGSLKTTFTYDSRPVGRDPPLARRVSDEWGVPNVPVSLTPDEALRRLDDGVSLTDGLVPWPSFLNLTTAFQIENRADVVFEACGQGILLGSGIWRPDAERSRSAAETLYRAEHWLDATSVRQVMPDARDPMATYREVTTPEGGRVGWGPKSPSGDRAERLNRALVGLHTYYFGRGDFLSNRVARSQVGTRVPYANEALLSHLERMPYAYRERTIPFTGGRVPYGCAPLKRDIVCRLGGGVTEIPYERSGLAPTRPLWQHAAGFVCTTAADRLRSREGPTYGGVSIPGHWYREHEGFRTYVDDLLFAACERPFFDGSELRRRRRAHLAGTRDEIRAISAVTTAERWLQDHVDTSTRARVAAAVASR